MLAVIHLALTRERKPGRKSGTWELGVKKQLILDKKRGANAPPVTLKGGSSILLHAPTAGTNKRIVIGVVGIITRTTLRLYAVEEVT